MNNRISFAVIVLITLLISGCSTSQSAFKKGEYYDATLKAVKQLRNNPDSKKALVIVQKSYPMALEYDRQKVNELSLSNHPDKYMKIVETYTRLNILADEITRCPAALEALKPVVYFHSQLQKAEELAVNEQFSAAIRLVETGNYQDARIAVERLEWVKQKNPKYRNVDEQLANARNLATLKTVVELKPELNVNYDINSKVFYLRVYDFLNKNIANQFTKFYQPDQAEKIALSPQEIVTIQILEFQIGAMIDKEKEHKFVSDSLVVGTFTDSKGVEHNVFGTVKATVNEFERELIARGLVEIKIIDFDSQEIITSQKFPGEFMWRNNWATYNGDQRAVPDHIYKLTKEKQMMPPSPQDMFLLLSDPLFSNASQFLRNYYRKK